jgi:hypothetical protein
MLMRWHKHVVLGLALVGTTVFAQPSDTPPSGETPRSTRIAPPGEMIQQAKDMLGKMQDILKRVVQLQEVARKQKDIIKLNCVNDKLVQIKGNMNVAETANTAMNEAMARGDDAQRGHEFTRVGLVFQKVQVLGTEAENCIGEDLTFIGQTEVKVEVDPGLPETDPTKEPTPEPVIERPPVSSPFN